MRKKERSIFKYESIKKTYLFVVIIISNYFFFKIRHRNFFNSLFGIGFKYLKNKLESRKFCILMRKILCNFYFRLENYFKMDQINKLVEPGRQFFKDSYRLVKKCTKPDRKGINC
jgi:hypothetical protein